MVSRKYPSDLSDAEWSLLEPHLPGPKRRGRPRLHSPREVLDAVFYVLKTGCQWRMLPKDFPPWQTVFHYFRRWRLDGVWERMNRALRRSLRKRLGREPEPSAGIVDAQSVKTTGVGGEQRGFDGGKKVRGRKRHILVDTEGLVVEAQVHSAKVPDQDGIRRLLGPARDRLPRLSHLWVDAGYRGRGKEWAEGAYAASEGLFRNGFYETQDEAQSSEDVDDCEKLAQSCGGREVTQANGCQRGHAKIEGVHYAPPFFQGVEDRPAKQREKDQADEGTELGIPPPSVHNGLEQAHQGGEELDHELHTPPNVEDEWTVPSYMRSWARAFEPFSDGLRARL
jgi:transposase